MLLSMAENIQRHKEKLEVWKINIFKDCYNIFHNLTIIISEIGHHNIALC